MEKYDLNGVRTPQDVIRRFDLKNIKVLMDDVEGITTEVSKKVGNDEIISKINQSAEEVSIKANKISLEGVITNNKGFAIDKNGNMECKNAKINGSAIVNGDNFTVDKEGNMSCNDATINGTLSQMQEGEYYNIQTNVGDPRGTGNAIEIISYDKTTGDERSKAYMNPGNFAEYENGTMRGIFGYGGVVWLYNEYGTKTIDLNGNNGNITCVSLTQTSLEKDKKNIKKYENALEEVLKTDIYEYNLKTEKDTDKKHIGFVIGDKYNYSKKIISVNEKNEATGVDTYSMVSLCLQAIKEQQKEIEELKKKVNK